MGVARIFAAWVASIVASNGDDLFQSSSSCFVRHITLQ